MVLVGSQPAERGSAKAKPTSSELEWGNFRYSGEFVSEIEPTGVRFFFR